MHNSNQSGGRITFQFSYAPLFYVMIARLRQAGYPVDIEVDETCCYAVQNKVWATDPDGRRWETYFVVAESEERNIEAKTCCQADAAESAAPAACC